MLTFYKILKFCRIVQRRTHFILNNGNQLSKYLFKALWKRINNLAYTPFKNNTKQTILKNNMIVFSIPYQFNIHSYLMNTTLNTNRSQKALLNTMCWCTYKTWIHFKIVTYKWYIWTLKHFKFDTCSKSTTKDMEIHAFITQRNFSSLF